MSDMLKETLSFPNKGLEDRKDTKQNNPFLVDGSSALEPDYELVQLPPDFYKPENTGKTEQELFDEYKKYLTENALLTNYSNTGAQKAPRGIGLVGNQGRETSGGDRTGGDGTEEKRKRMPKWLVRTIAGVATLVTLATGGKVLANNGFFGGNGGNENEGAIPSSSTTTPGKMDSLEYTPSATPTAEVTPTPSPSPTEAPTPTVTPETTSTPNETSPTPTSDTTEKPPLILKGKDKVEFDVNQRFADFLSGEGEFTDEKIREYGFVSDYTNEGGLGCLASVAGTIFVIQGIPLYYEKTDQGEFFAFATKTKDGKRAIIPMEYPSQSYVNNNEDIIYPIYSDKNFSSSIRKVFVRRNSDYYTFLNSNINKFSLILINGDVRSKGSYYNELSDGAKKVYSESIDTKIDVNRSFMSSIGLVDTSDHQFLSNSSELLKQFYDSQSGSILTVDNFDDFESLIENNSDQIPVCNSFSFMSFD